MAFFCIFNMTIMSTIIETLGQKLLNCTWLLYLMKIPQSHRQIVSFSSSCHDSSDWLWRKCQQDRSWHHKRRWGAVQPKTNLHYTSWSRWVLFWSPQCTSPCGNLTRPFSHQGSCQVTQPGTIVQSYWLSWRRHWSRQGWSRRT